VDHSALELVERRERAELERRARQYRGGRRRLDLENRCAVIVDDGVATGSTVRAACHVARHQGADRIVVAVPVASRLALHELADVCDDMLCVEVPDPFYAVGEWYRDFSQTSDEEVVTLLARATGDEATTTDSSRGGAGPNAVDVEVPSGAVTLPGRLIVPDHPRGTVVFAHGSGSSRHSPRNRFVAESLHHAGLSTLLVDLLTAEEELDRSHVFDISLLATRLDDAAHWVRGRPECRSSPLGFFGASTGAAAALRAAAQPDSDVSAVVSRGGRPDLAGSSLADVRAPTLLIVGERDAQVLQLNKTAQSELRCPCELAVVPGATHLFEERGALERVAKLASAWFVTHLTGGAVPPRLGGPRRT